MLALRKTPNRTQRMCWNAKPVAERPAYVGESLRDSHSFSAKLFVALTLAAVIGGGALSNHCAAQDVNSKQNGSTKSPTVDFSREVQPLLAKRCFQCHGPDKQEGGLRFDKHESVLAKLESGAAAVVPGNDSKSELLRRIASTDKDERMPPEGKPLTADQIDTLRRWIQEGANWQEHWGFRAPQVLPPPAVKNSAWVKNPIDAFVLSKLEKSGLAPNAPADKAALVRRAYYDLTGLPPSPADVDAFLADKSPKAFETVIDRLLESQHYGEKWGRHWLDLVRYADTNSFERDGDKPHSWRYRDYVIRSFNSDKPYDQFVREQLAGDEFAAPTADTIVATGYYRLGLWDDEPADRMLAKFDVLDDIVATTGQVFLGLTVNCARCHDHKIDPIPQKDYYSLLAFFHGITPNGYGPNVERPIFANDMERLVLGKKAQELEDRRNSVQAEILAIERQFKEQFEAKTTPSIDGKTNEKPAATIKTTDLDELEYRYYRDSWDKLPNFDEVKAETVAPLPMGLFDISPTTRETDYGFVFTGFLKVPQNGEYTFYLDSDDGSRLIVDGKTVVEHDGIHGTSKPKQATVALKAGRSPIRLEYFQRKNGYGLLVEWAGPGVPRRFLSTIVDSDRQPKTKNSNKKEKISDVAAMIKSSGKLVLGEKRFVEYEKLQRQFEKLKTEKVQGDMALCVTERGPTAPDTFILLRGNPRSEGEKVVPGFPTILGGGEASPKPPAKGANSSGRRLALADWIASGENRLTSRVMMNRVWQFHFGRGIVRSSNNFGFLGDAPTHPELLDWLGSEFVKSGWRMKAMHKLIMLSNTYQMSSRGNDAALAKDPINNLFWRFDMRRLSAEEVRDSVHVVSGAFNPTMYGPGVYPEISAEVLAGQSAPGKGWGKSSPDDQARRSVYIHVKRSLITPLLADFDFSDTDSSCAVRFATTQPTQALGMLNGGFLNKQAVQLADRLRRDAGSSASDQVKMALRLTLSRPVDEKEIARGVAFIRSFQDKYKLDANAALNYYCLLVLNLNEFVYLD